MSVGLDVEWKPAFQRGSPDSLASILQASMPNRVMIFDLIWAAGEARPASRPHHVLIFVLARPDPVLPQYWRVLISSTLALTRR